MWQVGLHLSLTQLSKKEAALELFNSTAVWHGSLVFNKVGVMLNNNLKKCYAMEW